MNRIFRGTFIVWTVWRFGLHELVLSNFKHPLLKYVSMLLTLGRTYQAPRGERLR
jgi:ubiquinone biosynthesis protein